MPSGIDFGYIAGVLPKLATMLPITLFVVVISGFFSFFLGIGFTAIRVKRTKLLFPIISVCISFLRSTPILIQLFVVYYGIPTLFKVVGIDINQWSRIVFAVVTLVLHDSSFLSEILRPAYLSIDKGQHDAADSIGMTGLQKLFRIIGPQVVPIALPSAGNLLIDLIKDTSILFTIGVVDLMGRAKLIIANDYGVGKMQVLIAVALIYWLISAAVEKVMRLLEKRNERYKLAKGIRA